MPSVLIAGMLLMFFFVENFELGKLIENWQG